MLLNKTKLTLILMGSSIIESHQMITELDQLLKLTLMGSSITESHQMITEQMIYDKDYLNK
jgi:hypothetical protein